MQTTTPQLILAQGLCQEFYDKSGRLSSRALDGIDFTLPKGSLTAMVGPDGAGKTTFMRLVAGLLLPTSGTLEVLGLPVTTSAAEIQERLGYMPQKFGLYEDLSIQENLNLYADLHGIKSPERDRRFERLLNMTGLTPFTSRLAGKLSGGMKQKLGLICTLIRAPELLLLDEPTVGVDPLSRRELWEILKELVKEEQLSVLVNTALMEEAELCDLVYVLNQGRILAKDSPAELKQLAQGRCLAMRPGKSLPMRVLQSNLLDDKEHVIDAVPQAGRVRFICTADTPREYFAKRFPFAAEPVEARLEDAFMLLLSADQASRAEQAEKLTLPPLPLDGAYAPAEEIDIEVRELVRRFGSFVAVNKTSFTVHRGEVFGLLGPNGAGKTTTFRMLCGLLPSSDGYLSVAGVNLRTARTQARRNIGYVAQKFSLYGELTVRENLSFFGGAYGIPRARLARRINEVLQEFHLQHLAQHKAGDLPGGYKQRLSMAAALLHEPQILFLDEPTSGIDPLARRDFWRQITALAARGTTVIITTHLMEESEYCDRIMIQDQGRLLTIGTPQEIREAQGDSQLTMNEVFIRIVEKSRLRRTA